MTNEKKSFLCPSCGGLVSGYTTQCPHCSSNINQAHFNKYINNLTNWLNEFENLKQILIGLFILSYLVTLFTLNKSGFSRGMLGLPEASPLAYRILGWASGYELFNKQFYVLFTAIFLHGGPIHLFFNYLWLRDLGPLVANTFSKEKAMLIFLLSGASGNLLTCLISPYSVLGASGGIFGFMGAMIVFGLIRGGSYGKNIIRHFLGWAAIIIAMGFFIRGVSNSAHIGGLIGGVIIGFVLYKLPQSADRFLRNLSLFIWLIIFYGWGKAIWQLTAFINI